MEGWNVGRLEDRKARRFEGRSLENKKAVKVGRFPPWLRAACVKSVPS